MELYQGILSKKQIIERIIKGDLAFDPPLDIFQPQIDAIDLRLGFTFQVPKRWKMTKKGREQIVIDPLNRDDLHNYDVITLEHGQTFELLPHEWVRCCSLERVKIPADLIALMFPRSSSSRDGLSVDITGPVDAHYDGFLIIPITNNTDQPYTLYPGTRIAQLIIATLTTPAIFVKSRWAGTDVVVNVKPEKDRREVELIKNGKIVELKKEFPLITNEK
jgi:dCTP deaminase